MPEFAPSESKTAIVPITVAPSGLSCETEIFLGPDETTKVVTTGRIPFTSIGISQDVRLPITMPDAAGTYHVFIDVYAEEILVAAYQSIEDVIIAAPAFTFSDVSAEMVGCIVAPAWKTMNFDCRITNPTDQTLTRTIKTMRNYYDDAHPGISYGPWEITAVRTSLTLGPGESYDYHFEGNYYSTTGPLGPSWYAYFGIHSGQTHCLWLEDETGNKSPEACVHRA